MAIALNVNDTRHELSVDGDTPLVFVLRNELGLTGTKLGCGLEQCGACAVLIDGVARYSCTEPLSACDGRHVETAEFLSEVPEMRRLFDALKAHNAAQCGYCSPGIFVALCALLRRDDQPDEAAIRAALTPHLCRCGSHARVLRAAREAAGLS